MGRFTQIDRVIHIRHPDVHIDSHMPKTCSATQRNQDRQDTGEMDMGPSP